MFHEWKHRVVIEYQMMIPTNQDSTRCGAKVNVFIMASNKFQVNLTKYLSTKGMNSGQVVMQRSIFVELEEFIHGIKKTDKALSQLEQHQCAYPKTAYHQAKLSRVLDYLENRLGRDQVVIDVICVPKGSYGELFGSTSTKMKKQIQDLKLETPAVWGRVRDALKEWSLFDRTYAPSPYEDEPDRIKFVLPLRRNNEHSESGYVMVVFEQHKSHDWLVSLCIECRGPQSRRMHQMITERVIQYIEDTVKFEKQRYELRFLDKRISDILVSPVSDGNDVGISPHGTSPHDANSDVTDTEHPELYPPLPAHSAHRVPGHQVPGRQVPGRGVPGHHTGASREQMKRVRTKRVRNLSLEREQERQVRVGQIRSYLHSRCWLLVLPPSSVLCRYLMSMFTDLKLREGFKLLSYHSNGCTLGHWIRSQRSVFEHETNGHFAQSRCNRLSGNYDSTFVQLIISKVADRPRELRIELAVEPSSRMFTFHEVIGGEDRNHGDLRDHREYKEHKMVMFSTEEIMDHLTRWTQFNIMR